MANTRTKVYDLKPIIKEIQNSEGLPENLSTEAQLWDEILKKEVFLIGEQLLPLIKEIYGKTYPRDTAIKPLATEYSVDRVESGKISSIRADITVIIGETDIYHFECEIEKDGTMVIRMLEYDIHIALSYAKADQSGNYKIHFPNSAILYLQTNHTVPNSLNCQIIFQDGTAHTYSVPVIKVQSYSLEEIHQKHLCVLIPFLPLRFRKKLNSKKGMVKDELTDFFQQIIIMLDDEVENGYLTDGNRKAILSLLSKSMIRVFYTNEELLKEVVKLTKPILELEFEKVERLEKEKAVLQDKNVALQDENTALLEKCAQMERELERFRKSKTE